MNTLITSLLKVPNIKDPSEGSEKNWCLNHPELASSDPLIDDIPKRWLKMAKDPCVHWISLYDYIYNKKSLETIVFKWLPLIVTLEQMQKSFNLSLS